MLLLHMIDMTRKPIRIGGPGRYLTRDRRIATIHLIDRLRAFGRSYGSYDDGTWWYLTGEHAVCPSDDLMLLLERFEGKTLE